MDEYDGFWVNGIGDGIYSWDGEGYEMEQGYGDGLAGDSAGAGNGGEIIWSWRSFPPFEFIEG